MDGLNRISNNENPLIFFNTIEKTPTQNLPEIKGIYKIIHNFFYQNKALKNFYINKVSRYQKHSHEDYVNFLKNADKICCNYELFNKINLKKTKTIHTHTVGDAVKVINTIRNERVKDIKIMLTCHTPETPSDEYYKDYLERGFSIQKAAEVRDYWRIIEKKAFLSSDILVFPSKEAMEPLMETMNDFSNIIKNKDIRFIPSGAKQLRSTLTKEEAKKKYGVEGKFVVGYVGRHNEVKGYDLLQAAAKKVCAKDDSIVFLIGGKQGETFMPLNQTYWIEAGWVNPADLFMAIDIFVLPNRMTYFDLVLLEIMSMGIPVVASATGGNISVNNVTGTLELYNNTVDGLVDSILKCSNKNISEIEMWKNKTISAYKEYYTTSIFAQNYIQLINQIYKDYNFL